MQPKHFRSLFLLLFLNLLIKPFWILGIDRNVQLSVGEANYGLYASLFSFSLLLQIILDPGLHTHTNKMLAQNPSLLSKYISSFIPLKLILCAVYIIISLIFGLILGYHGFSIYLLFLLLFNQVLASIILYFRANLAGLHLFRIDSIVSVLDRTLMIIFCSFLLWGGVLHQSLKIEWFIYAQTFAYFITAIFALVLVFKHSAYFKPRINILFLRVILRESYPYALLGILMTIYTRIDVIMIERMLPKGALEAGTYYKAYRLLDAFNMVAFLFATILLPVFSGMIKRKEPLQHTVSTTYSLLMIPSFLLALTSFYYRNEIMHLLYHNSSDHYLGMVFGCLMFTQLAISTVYIYGTLLTANGNIRFLNISSGAGVLVNVILNFVLIRQYGALGAVFATLGTQIIVSGVQMYKAHQLFGMHVPLNVALRTLGFLILALFSFQFGSHYLAQWWLSVLLLCIINITFALILKLIKPGFFLELLKLNNK